MKPSYATGAPVKSPFHDGFLAWETGDSDEAIVAIPPPSDDELDRQFGNVPEDDGQTAELRLAARFRQILVWLISVNTPAAVRNRVFVAVATLCPELLEGSLAELSRELGCSKQNLAQIQSAFCERFRIENRSARPEWHRQAMSAAYREKQKRRGATPGANQQQMKGGI